MDNAYRRFLAKRIKAEWGLEGIPVRIYAMKRGGRRLSATPVAEGHKEQEIPEAQDLDFEIPMDIPDEFIGESAPL